MDDISQGRDESSHGRREFLTAVGAAGTAVLAGCGGKTDTKTGSPTSERVPAPEVDTADRWALVTPDSESRLLQEGSILGVDYEAVGHIRRFEDKMLKQRISQQTFGEIDRPFALAFAARVDIFPGIASKATLLKNGEIDNALEENLRTSMQEFGVRNVRGGGRMDASSTPASGFIVVKGDYPIAERTIKGVDIPHTDRSTLKFGGDTLSIKGIVGRWKQDGSILAAGGVYPAAEFRDVNKISLSEAITVSVMIDLNINPTQRERQVLDFARSVSL